MMTGSVLTRLRNAAAVLAGAVALAACGGGGSAPKGGVLHIYNLSDYIDPKILADFTSQTGIKVQYDTFDSGDMLETKVLTGNSGYDIVVPSNQYVPRFATAKAIQPLDQTKLPNAKNLWPQVMRYMAPFDPGAKYAVPYMWGTGGIGYNAD